MKKLLLALLLAAPFTAWSQLITVNSFNNIQYWTGTGTNRAALVLEFGNSATPSSAAWGYRWSGSATAASMLFALAGSISGSNPPSPVFGSDPRLSIELVTYSSVSGYFVDRISYNQIGLPNPWSQTTRVIQNEYSPELGEGPFPTLYSLNGAGIWSASFVQAQVGMSTLALSNGMWVGFVQSDGTDNLRTFAQPAAAVPEPRIVGLLVVGLLFVVFANSKKTRTQRS